MSLTFFSSILGYEAYEKKDIATSYYQWELIQQFTISIILEILRGKKSDLSIATSYCTCSVPHLTIRFTPSIYNYFVNISSIFKIQDNDDAWKEIVRDKRAIMTAQKKIGIVKKRGIMTKYWYKYYCILSGGYLYFYEANKQVYPSYYYYLKNAEAITGETEIGIQNTLIIRNIETQSYCYLAMTTKAERDSWKKAIEDQVAQMNVGNIAKKPPKALAGESLLNETTFSVGALKAEIYEENKELILTGDIRQADGKVTVRPYDTNVKLGIINGIIKRADKGQGSAMNRYNIILE